MMKQEAATIQQRYCIIRRTGAAIPLHLHTLMRCAAARVWLTFIILMFAPPHPLQAELATGQQAFNIHLQRGQDALLQGKLETAATEWEQAVQSDYSDASARADLHGHLAGIYLRLGKYSQATGHLDTALGVATEVNDPLLHARLRRQLGTTYLRGGHIDAAREHLQQALEQAEQLDSPAVIAASCNDLGNLEMHQGNHKRAAMLYLRSAKLAGDSGYQLLAARARSNAAAAELEFARAEEANEQLRQAEQAAGKISDSHDKAFLLLRLGVLRQQLGRISAERENSAKAYALFDQAHDLAERLGDSHALAYALGYLGALYEQQGYTKDALRLTQHAVFLAREVTAPEALYRWQWQAARLLGQHGRQAESLAHYRHAVAVLEQVRPELMQGFTADRQGFPEEVADLYRDYVSLLLDLGMTTTDPAVKKRFLWEAQEVMEHFKAAELQDYFRDDCVAAAQEKVRRIDRALSPGTVVIYPVILPERIVLLLTFASDMQAVEVDISENRVNAELDDLRHKLEKRTTREYLKPAGNLYNWLIKPVESTLRSHDTHTIVVVPGGALRTIPLAALHDGQQFLIEKYAIATTPGIELTDPRPIDRDNIKVLLSGITKPRQGFSSLPHVNTELDEIQHRYGGHRLQDEAFVNKALRSELEAENYSIVHIASHGKFEAQIEDSFILTFNDRLKLNALENYMSVNRYREQPVELLTLSACQTAVGDDRAALGLAGIAVKAGARSALASLWHINDQATALLVNSFYAQLNNPLLSKAEALQRAQLELIADQRYRHPGYWSAFLLIGNWQ